MGWVFSKKIFKTIYYLNIKEDISPLSFNYANNKDEGDNDSNNDDDVYLLIIIKLTNHKLFIIN